MKLEEKVTEWLEIKAMIKELEASKKLLEVDLKEVTKKGPITLADGRTLETVSTIRTTVDPKKVRALGLFDDLCKQSIINTIKVK